MESFTFICGCGHSGTTLLATMFAANQNIFIPLAETSIFYWDPKSHQPWHDLFVYGLWEKSRVMRHWRRLVAQATASGRPHLVEKTPRHVRRLDLIRRYVPRAKFILMTRDGRDVAASIMRRSGDLQIGVRRWIDDNRIVAVEMRAPDALLLRYEDLIGDTEQSLRRCCAFAGIPFDPAMLDYHSTPHLWFGETSVREGTGKDEAEHHALRNWQVNQPLFDGRGKWRRQLSEAQVAALPKAEMLPLFAALGYDW